MRQLTMGARTNAEESRVDKFDSQFLEAFFSKEMFEGHREARHEPYSAFYPFGDHMISIINVGITYEEMDRFITGKEAEEKAKL